MDKGLSALYIPGFNNRESNLSSSVNISMCCVLCLVAQSCHTFCGLMDCSPPGSSVHGDSPGNNIGVGCHALLQRNLPDPGIEPGSPALQAYSFQSEPPGKPEFKPRSIKKKKNKKPKTLLTLPAFLGSNVIDSAHL